MRWLTNVNLCHNRNTISILAPSEGFRRKKSNCIPLTERWEGRRTNAHSFCVLTETITVC